VRVKLGLLFAFKELTLKVHYTSHILVNHDIHNETQSCSQSVIYGTCLVKHFLFRFQIHLRLVQPVIKNEVLTTESVCHNCHIWSGANATT